MQIETGNHPYDWKRKYPYSIEEFFSKIDSLVESEFYGSVHPLSRKWIDGELSMADLRFIATQEYPYYASTTWWNALKLANSFSIDHQRSLLDPLIDELGSDAVFKEGEWSHIRMFLYYCQGLGLAEQEVLDAAIVPAVTLAVTELMRMARHRPVFEFLAASNLVVEKMRPIHYRDVLHSFEVNYSEVDRKYLKFYEVHAILDDGHHSLGREIVTRFAEGSIANQDAVFSAVIRSLGLRNVMYDGIQAAIAAGYVGTVSKWPNYPHEPWPREA